MDHIRRWRYLPHDPSHGGPRVESIALSWRLLTVLVAAGLFLSGCIPSPPAPSPSKTPASPGNQSKHVHGGFLFGVGSQAYGALDKPIVREVPVNMITSWYNYRTDMAFFDKF